MENQGRPASVRGGWLASPLYDLIFLANLGWLLLLIPGWSNDSGTPIDFWQVYFITLPHRWITLVLVAIDSDRRGDQSRLLVGIAIAFALLVGTISLTTGALVCLALIDFAWNAWHFAAQHSGILRTYGIKTGAGPSRIERWGLRLFVTYAIIRTASWATGWAVGDSQWETAIFYLDRAMLVLPVAVVGRVLISGRLSCGRLIYLASVILLYSGILVATMLQEKRWLIPLLVGSSLFHATEYLAYVSLYADKRQRIGSANRFRKVAFHWLGFLACYIVILGCVGVGLESSGYASIWAAINLWAAFTHYAFDGLIWKLRRSSTAQAVGAQS